MAQDHATMTLRRVRNPPVNVPMAIYHLGISAVAYACLSLAIGFGPATLLILAAVLIGFWALICKRFPFLGYLSIAFATGFIGGLFGRRSRYYYYRPRCRRR
jgi:4-hydroxybenzoate polyprenyltransferase